MNPSTASWRALLLWLVAAAACAQALEVIDLRHRTAEEVIPVLQPLLEPGDALSGSDHKLFVRASANNVAQLRRALAQLDRPPLQWLVSVRRASRRTIEREIATASVAAGNRGAIATVQATDDAAHRQGSSIASVQVLEGGSAFISTGQSVPVVSAVVLGGHRPWIGATASHRDVSSGFLVTPRVAAQRVTLDIEQHAQWVGASQAVETQAITTQVSGALGEWITLGGVSEPASARSGDLLSGRYSTRSDEMEVWVKVEAR